MITVSDLIQVEQHPELLQFAFEFDGLLMWPFVRAKLLFEAIARDYGLLPNPHAASERLSIGQLATYACRSIVENPLTSRRPFDIVMFVSGIANVNRGSGYFNRLHDNFALEFKNDTLLIEDSTRKRYLRPRTFPNVKCHDLVTISGALWAKCRAAKARDVRVIGQFFRFLRDRFAYSFEAAFWDNLEDYLRERARRFPVLHWWYSKMFEQLKPKIIFQEDASYGSRSYICKWARAHGIPTAEVQHGIIVRNHPAYNYAQALVDSAEYAQYLPQYLLVYGEYWAQRVRTASKTVLVGNPYLSERLCEKAEPQSNGAKKKILIISGIGFPEELKRVTLRLTQKLGLDEYEVILRPHPGEVPYAEERYGDLQEHGVKLDVTRDFYRSLAQADFVAGEISTALYEALAFGKKVVVYDHAYTELHFEGEQALCKFKTGSDLARIIQRGSAWTHLDNRWIWESEWRTRYRDFINEVLHRQPC
jgi:hypothetical protein